MIRDHDTIAAPATAAGGALAVIRISGEEALRICDRIFRGREPLAAAAGYTVHYGEIVDDGRVLDDVLVTVFRAPRSYTGEDAAEISSTDRNTSFPRSCGCSPPPAPAWPGRANSPSAPTSPAS